MEGININRLFEEILNSMNCLYIVIDNDKIIYPKESCKIKFFQSILNCRNNKDIFCADGKWFECEEKMIMHEKKEYKVIFLKDITKYITMKREYEIDETTNLYTKKKFFEQMDNQLVNNINKGKEFNIIIGDIDFFKSINDKYGHLFGDYVLGKIGDILNKTVRAYDRKNIVGRFGGEEFIFFIPNMNSDECYELIENVRNIIKSEIFINEKTVVKNITMSFGIYNYNKNTKNNNVNELRNNLIECADKALYESKNTGRDKTMIYKCEKRG